MAKENVIEISLLSGIIGLFRRNCQVAKSGFCADSHMKIGNISELMNEIRRKERGEEK